MSAGMNIAPNEVVSDEGANCVQWYRQVVHAAWCFQ